MAVQFRTRQRRVDQERYEKPDHLSDQFTGNSSELSLINGIEQRC